jgi:hypothetical protein
MTPYKLLTVKSNYNTASSNKHLSRCASETAFGMLCVRTQRVRTRAYCSKLSTAPYLNASSVNDAGASLEVWYSKLAQPEHSVQISLHSPVKLVCS